MWETLEMHRTLSLVKIQLFEIQRRRRMKSLSVSINIVMTLNSSRVKYPNRKIELNTLLLLLFCEKFSWCKTRRNFVVFQLSATYQAQTKISIYFENVHKIDLYFSYCYLLIQWYELLKIRAIFEPEENIHRIIFI